ncbi:MAG: NHL repeat protein [Planctomycetes bacterium ADurb.Bin126]|nr:MAG: NHL repeat protein [Planctomycetes bacterium ADurb.Bin126]HOD83064.1 hypothetical protein [Phycisphaerae bacterium]HQL72942.1 hypothetical protein [Phycisphaerae bacterium]
MTRNRIVASLTLMAAATAFLAGCQKPQPKAAAIFYPPAPDLPRLQFLTSFADPEVWVKKKSSFADVIVGAEPTGERDIKSPYGIAARDGKIYICDIGRSVVHVIDLSGRTYSKLGGKDQIRTPVSITIAPDGTRYVCDTGLGKVAIYDAQDRFVRHIGDPQRAVPSDLAVDGQTLVVANRLASTVEVWDKSGKLLKTIARKGRAPGELQMPFFLDINPAGEIFVTDAFASIVNVYDREGRYLRSLGAPGDRPGFFARPKGIAVGPNGNIFIADAQWEAVQVFAPQGHVLLSFGESGTAPHDMSMPAGLAFDNSTLEYFRSFVDPGFQAETLLFVCNQQGRSNNKILVYAFGNTEKAKAIAATRPAAKPASRPVATQPATPGEP